MRALLYASLLLAVTATGPAAAAGPATAADTPALQQPPPLAKGVASFPRPAAAGEAAERIDHALAAVERSTQAALADCRQQAGSLAYWHRSVWVTMQGPRYLSLFVSDDADCGGAHPNESQIALVYDLRSGRPVDWQRLLPHTLAPKARLDTAMDGTRIGEVSGPSLTALYLKAIKPEADCREALTGDTLWFELWPDAKAGGLAVMPSNLPHVVQGCAATATFMPAQLRQMGVDPALIAAIETGHAKGWYGKDAP